MDKRIKDFIRTILRNRVGEKILIELNQRNKWFRKLVSSENAYPPETFRIAQRDGVFYQLDISDVIGHSLFFFNYYFAPLEVFNLLRTGSVFIDVGANIGTVAMRAAKICVSGHVYAFEPDPNHVKSLKINQQLNSFSNITIIPRALGSKPSQAVLSKLEQRNAGMNRILPPEHVNRYNSNPIEVVTLDDEMEQLRPSRVDLIKIDVEGYEFHVLMGAQKTIARYQPILIVEVIDANLQVHQLSSANVINLLQSWGYEIIDLKTRQPILAGAKIETDILCSPQKRN
ncbi:MAG: FkbM family methyltransferase [Cytophagales bacterium]|jgi:FkbM family methyltransferase|nr:FkbM family methyltransferase [Cytophagales bacterium]MCZ8069454.1 FkbM family methyltransferase [Cytophagales bacterium]